MRQLKTPRQRHSVLARRNRLSPSALLAIIAIVLVWIAQFVAYSRGTIVMQDEYTRVMTYELPDSSLRPRLRLIGTVCFAGAGIMAAWNARTIKMPHYAIVALLLLLGASATWFFIAYSPETYLQALVSDVSPFIFFMCLGVFVGMDETLWPWLETASLCIAYASALVGIYFLWKNPLDQKSGLFPPPFICRRLSGLARFACFSSRLTASNRN